MSVSRPLKRFLTTGAARMMDLSRRRKSSITAVSLSREPARGAKKYQTWMRNALTTQYSLIAAATEQPKACGCLGISATPWRMEYLANAGSGLACRGHRRLRATTGGDTSDAFSAATTIRVDGPDCIVFAVCVLSFGDRDDSGSWECAELYR